MSLGISMKQKNHNRDRKTVGARSLRVTIINEKLKTHYKMAGVHLIVGMIWAIVFQSVSFAIFFIMSLVNCRKAMILEKERFEIT